MAIKRKVRIQRNTSTIRENDRVKELKLIHEREKKEAREAAYQSELELLAGIYVQTVRAIKYVKSINALDMHRCLTTGRGLALADSTYRKEDIRTGFLVESLHYCVSRKIEFESHDPRVLSEVLSIASYLMVLLFSGAIPAFRVQAEYITCNVLQGGVVPLTGRLVLAHCVLDYQHKANTYRVLSVPDGRIFGVSISDTPSYDVDVMSSVAPTVASPHGTGYHAVDLGLAVSNVIGSRLARMFSDSELGKPDGIDDDPDDSLYNMEI